METTLVQSFPNSYGARVNQFFIKTETLGTIKVDVTHHTHGWTATEENYDGPEDCIRINHSFTAEGEAIAGLIESMEERELTTQTQP